MDRLTKSMNCYQITGTCNDPVIIEHPKEAIPDVDEYTANTYDQYLTAEVMILIGDE